MPVEFAELTDDTQSLINTFENEVFAIRERMKSALASARSEDELRRILFRLLEGSLSSLNSALEDLKHPVIIVEIDSSEAKLADFMKTSGDAEPYFDPTECSAEEDEEED